MSHIFSGGNPTPSRPTECARLGPQGSAATPSLTTKGGTVADNQVWKDAEREIQNKLDIAAVYRDLGTGFVRETPTAKGWLACHAHGRADGTASAAVNVGEGPMRGRYRDMGGEGLSLNLWEFAAKFGKFADWRAARRYYADKVGVALPAGGEPKRPDDQVEFLTSGSADLILRGWAEIKGGFDLATVKANGGVYGRYPKKAKPEHAQYVVAFPAYNPPALCDGDPSAWVIANTNGRFVTIYRGKGKPPTDSKTLSVGGSIGGLLGRPALRALSAERDRTGPGVEVVWKVEGLSDLLTMYAALSNAGLLGKHVVLSNSQGALESVKPEWVELLAGKVVYVVHDRDRPGETGAGRWVHMLVGRCPVVKDIRLPYAMKDSHGEDLRDFLHRDKKPLTDLFALADSTAPAKPGTRKVTAPLATPVPPLPAGGAGLFDEVTGSPSAIPVATEKEDRPLPGVGVTKVGGFFVGGMGG